MADPYGTPAMFDEIPNPPVAPILTDTSGGYGKASYARYRVQKAVRCDDCAAAFVKDRHAPASRTAAYKRTQAGTRSLVLCYEHMAMRKAKEGA